MEREIESMWRVREAIRICCIKKHDATEPDLYVMNYKQTLAVKVEQVKYVRDYARYSREKMRSIIAIYIYYICPELAFMDYRFRSGKGAWPL